MSHKNLHVLYSLGRPFAPVYGLFMSFRAALYEKGVFRRYRLPVPVVSVGNLTMGGTGKTPMTVYLAGLLSDRRPVIVSRGYGGNTKDTISVVSDGRIVHTDVSRYGDEPVLMATSLPGIPVLTGKKRSAVGRYAVAELQAGLVLLDDGFQHLALERDVNIVLFKVDSFLGNNRIFPGGDMREPLKSLHRADCFVLTCADEQNRERTMAIKKALAQRFPEIPSFLASYQPVAGISRNGSKHDMAELAEKSWFAFCGLAQPRSFKRTIELAGMQILGFEAFKDHHMFTDREVKGLVHKAKSLGAHGLITTEKDMVRLTGLSFDLPLMALQMAVVPEKEFDHFVLDKLG